LKKLAVTLFLTTCLLPFIYGQKTRLAPAPKARPGVEYPIKVHVSAVSIRKECPARLNNEPCNELDVDAIIDGKKIELRGVEVSYPSYKRFNVLPGDYKARLLKNRSNARAAPLDSEYELVLSDKSVWSCTVTGISE
jgi:hypothetical protein